MRWVTIRTDRGLRVCGRHDDTYVDIRDADPDLPGDLRSLLASEADAAGWHDRAVAAVKTGTTRYDRTEVVFGPPIPNPEKILCLGLNYREHAEEVQANPPAEPLIFSKTTNTLIGHREPIVLPEASDQGD